MVKNIFYFLAVIFLTFTLLPNINVFFRPNLILIFLIWMSFKIGFEKSIWFWIVGGIILDSLNIIKLPINSIIFISFFILWFLLKNLFEHEAFMSKIIIGGIYISSYFLVFLLRDFIAFNNFDFGYLRQFVITFLIFIFICFLSKTKNEKTSL